MALKPRARNYYKAIHLSLKGALRKAHISTLHHTSVFQQNVFFLFFLLFLFQGM